MRASKDCGQYWATPPSSLAISRRRHGEDIDSSLQWIGRGVVAQAPAEVPPASVEDGASRPHRVELEPGCDDCTVHRRPSRLGMAPLAESLQSCPCPGDSITRRSSTGEPQWRSIAGILCRRHDRGSDRAPVHDPWPPRYLPHIGDAIQKHTTVGARDRQNAGRRWSSWRARSCGRAIMSAFTRN